MTPKEQDKELRALLGEMPNFVIDWLELSDDLRNKWKKGGKASDFGGHRAFIQKYEKKLTKLIAADRKRVALEARLDELERLQAADMNLYKNVVIAHRIAELEAQQEEVR